MSPHAGRTRTWELVVASVCIAVTMTTAAAGAAGLRREGSTDGPIAAATLAPRVGPEAYCALASGNPLIFDSMESVDTLDPAVSYSYAGWSAIQQVYQTLVQYNGSSGTSLVPVLAGSWTVSPDGMNWTFHLRTGVRFSNGDFLSAYTMWFSLYRALATNWTPQFVLSQNFWYPGITYYSGASAQSNAWNYTVNALNTWNFAAPTANQIAAMAAPNQSFQAIDAQTLALHVGSGYLGAVPYADLLATLAAPVASAVDPVVVQANGGVSTSVNSWMATHMLGTGPFVQTAYSGLGYALAPDPNYWGSSAAAAQPWNSAIQAARASIAVHVETNTAILHNDLATGAAVGVLSPTLSWYDYQVLRTNPCVVTNVLPPAFGSTVGGWWVFMDQSAPPFNNLSVRRAVAHAINYSQIIASAFGGYADRWMGPVPPGYPYENPNGLAPYAYDLSLARQDMNASPWPLPTGYPARLNFLVPWIGSWNQVAVMITSDLAQIGINVNPVPVTLSQLYQLGTTDPSGVCYTDTTLAGGPFPVGLNYWSSDYLSADDWAQVIAASYGAVNVCMSRYANATVDRLVAQSAMDLSPASRTQEYAQITQMMYDNVTDAWLAVPDQFQAYHPSLRGIVANPMGSAAEFALTMNTMYAVPPLNVQLSAPIAPGRPNATYTFRANATGGTAPYSFAWEFGDGATASGSMNTTTHAYARPGNYTVNVTVRDPFGGYASNSLVLGIVREVPIAPPSIWPVVAVVGGIAVAGVAAAVAVILLLRRRRGASPPQEPPPGTPPPPGPPP